jgi:hypothetical protein
MRFELVENVVNFLPLQLILERKKKTSPTYQTLAVTLLQQVDGLHKVIVQRVFLEKLTVIQHVNQLRVLLNAKVFTKIRKWNLS